MQKIIRAPLLPTAAGRLTNYKNIRLSRPNMLMFVYVLRGA